MNICVFCHDAYMSGANRSLFDWISCDKKDHFIVFLPHRNSNQYFSDLENVEVISGFYFCLYKDLARQKNIYLLKKNIKTIYMFLFGRIIIQRLLHIVSKNKVDVIISNSFVNIYGALVAKKLDLPHFWHIREFMELDHLITHKDVKLVENLCEYSNAIFISDVIEEYYQKKYNFKNKTVIYNQISIEKNFKKEKVFFPQNHIKIIMSGTLQENKGQKEAISAVIKLLDNNYSISFDIFGDGPQKEELYRLIQNSGYSDYIKLKGYSSNLDDIRYQYDIALVCSSNEALGRVTIESMGSGCITIGANAGCTSKLINDGFNGYLYKLHDSDDLKEKILYCFEHKENMIQIRNNARKYVEFNFSKPIYNKIISYIELCNRREI